MSAIHRQIERLGTVADRLSDAAAALALVLLVAMIAVTLSEVVQRHFLNAPTIWAYDVSYMLNGSVFMLGAAFTLRREGHVRIDFLLRLFPPAFRDAMQAVFYLGLFVPALGLATYFAVGQAIRAVERGELQSASAWEPVIWPFLTGLALGMGLLLLQTLADGLRHAARSRAALRRPRT